MDLRGLCGGARRIVSGVVIFANPGTLAIGGGELPIVTYRVRVDERFKGEVEQVKGLQFADFRMLAARSAGTAGSPRRTMYIPGMPELAVGQRYLLFANGPNAIGMSPVVGRGRGLFRIFGGPGREAVANAYGHRTMLDGLISAQGERLRAWDGGPGRSAPGAIAYSQLAQEIRRIVRKEGGQP
jgi:hypothetical protein